MIPDIKSLESLKSDVKSLEYRLKPFKFDLKPLKSDAIKYMKTDFKSLKSLTFDLNSLKSGLQQLGSLKSLKYVKSGPKILEISEIRRGILKSGVEAPKE